MPVRALPRLVHGTSHGESFTKMVDGTFVNTVDCVPFSGISMF